MVMASTADVIVMDDEDEEEEEEENALIPVDAIVQALLVGLSGINKFFTRMM